MRKETICFVVLLLVGALPVRSQSLSDLFKCMPDSLLPYLSHNNRLDLLDFFEAGMEARVTNLFDGQTRLTALSADSLVLELSPSSSLSIRLCPVDAPIDSARQVLCLVGSVFLSPSECEQSTRFYSLRWRPLPESQLPQPFRQKFERNGSTLVSWDEKRLSTR